jgi:hypothetical protein
MKNRGYRQLELFTDGARAVAALQRPKPPRPTEADLLAKLHGARIRLREIVILRMKTWLPPETRGKLREAEAWRRGRFGCVTASWSAFARSSTSAEPSGTSRCEALRSGVDAAARARYTDIGA